MESIWSDGLTIERALGEKKERAYCKQTDGVNSELVNLTVTHGE